jgi:hypothetical protein
LLDFCGAMDVLVCLLIYWLRVQIPHHPLTAAFFMNATNSLDRFLAKFESDSPGYKIGKYPQYLVKMTYLIEPRGMRETQTL